jgi:arsenate reductase
MFSDTFAGIAPASAPAYVLAQLAGGVAALGLIRTLYPEPAAIVGTHPADPAPAADMVLPRAEAQAAPAA